MVSPIVYIIVADRRSKMSKMGLVSEILVIKLASMVFR